VAACRSARSRELTGPSTEGGRSPGSCTSSQVPIQAVPMSTALRGADRRLRARMRGIGATGWSTMAMGASGRIAGHLRHHLRDPRTQRDSGAADPGADQLIQRRCWSAGYGLAETAPAGAARPPRAAALVDEVAEPHGCSTVGTLVYRPSLPEWLWAISCSSAAAVLCAMLQLALGLGQFASRAAHLFAGMSGAQRSRVIVRYTAIYGLGTGATGRDSGCNDRTTAELNLVWPMLAPRWMPPRRRRSPTGTRGVRSGPASLRTR